MSSRRIVGITLGLVGASVVGAAIWSFLSRQQQESPAEIYNQRFTQGYEYALTKMRKVHRQHPQNAETRYWLASLLVENAKDERALIESLDLLDAAENRSQPNWIAVWSEARRLQVYGQGLAMLTAEGSPLDRAVKSPNGDAQLKKFVTEYLTSLDRIDSKLWPTLNQNDESALRKKETLTGDEVREDLLTLKNMLAERWAYVTEKETQTGKSLDDLLVQAFSEVRSQMTLSEATDVFLRFVASLEDGHTHIGYLVPSFSLPFRVLETAEGLVIAQTAQPSLGIEVGDRLIEVDGESVTAAVEARQKISTSSTSASRRAAAVRTLESHWSEERGYQVSVERRGQVITTEIKTGLIHEMPWSVAQRSSTSPWISSRALAPGVGYMKVSTWWPPTQSGPMNDDRLAKHRGEIDAAMAEINTSTDVVLDVRDNAGGSDSLCCYLASYFVPDPMKTYVLRYRIAPEKPILEGSDGFENPERMSASYPRQQGEVLKTRLWVLVNEGCFSATDTLLNVLTRNIPDRVVTIGRASGAGIGGPNLIGHLRNSGLPLTCSTCKAFSTDGELLEGNPVEVSHPVKWTAADVIAGKDPDLETALDLIRARVN
jgi:C-terminal processing protease CtpA/Prc